MIPGLFKPLMMDGGDPLDELGVIARSLRFRSSATASVNKTLGAPTNQKIWTYRALLKRSKLGADQYLLEGYVSDSQRDFLRIHSDDCLVFGYQAADLLKTTQPLRDVSSHLDVLLAVDTTQATASNRLKLYINGVQITSFSVASYPAQNATYNINSAISHRLMGAAFSGGYGFNDGYLSHVAFVDGQALAPSSFGQFHPKTGQWRPKSKAAIRAAVAAGGGHRNGWGANGCFLPFDDPTSLTTLGYDRSQSDTDTTGNNWTATNISLTAGVTYDSMLDTPTNNFTTMDPLVPADVATYSDGNLTVSTQFNPNSRGIYSSTIAIPDGVWQAEVVVNSNLVDYMIGVREASSAINGQFGADAKHYALYNSGSKMSGGSYTAYGASFTDGDIMGIKVTRSGGLATVEFFKAGVSQGIAFSGIPGNLFFACGDNNVSPYWATFAWNFGQRPFAYPISGAKALCTKNLSQAGSVTLSGTFTGNLNADGPFIFMNGCPETLTINGNAVTFGTHADRLANGFKIRTASSSYNNSGSNIWTATILAPSIKSLFRFQNAR